MYTTNLPDGVVIPDMLVTCVERCIVDDQAKSTFKSWVIANVHASEFMKTYWLKHVRINIDLCRTYGIPECVKLFSYAEELIEVTW